MDLSLGTSISSTQFSFKAEYLIHRQSSVYGRIDFQQRNLADAIIGIDTFLSNFDTLGFFTINRYSFESKFNMNLSIGYRVYSGNHYTKHKYNHSQFYLDIGAVYTIMLYKDSTLIPEDLIPFGLVLGTGYKFYFSHNFSVDFSLMTDIRYAKAGNSYGEWNGNFVLGIGYIIGGRQKPSKE